ncbi:MAG: ATP-binding cassette domain-containing protein [Phycisphaeraceae bacterium]
MPIIIADQLSKSYRVADKAPGVVNSLRHFFHRQYKTIAAVRGVSFTIEPGEIVGFLGPNGAGKTTTLKMLTGLVNPTSGVCTVAGHRPFARKAEFLRRITLVMGQKQQLLWDLPALDSLRINAAVYDVPESDAKERIATMANMLGMSKLLHQPVRKLSLGERMKAELMAALLHHPAVLFLDEPTLGLDVNAQSAVRTFLREYNQKHQATLLLTSHYMADITALCPRVILIHEGALMYDGSLEGIRQRFAPYREVKIELANDHNGRDFSIYGEVVAAQEREVRLIVHRQNLTRSVDRLLAELEVADLTVTDPPIEDVIGRIFTHGVGEGERSDKVTA